MSDTPDEQLESQLRELTTWPDATPNLWRRALAAANADRPGAARGLTRWVPGWAVAGLAAAVLFAAIGIWMEQIDTVGTGTLRSPARGTAKFAGDILQERYGKPADQLEHWAQSGREHTAEPEFRGGVAAGVDLVFEEDASPDGRFGAAEPGYARGRALLRTSGEPAAASIATDEKPSEVGVERHVIRKATIELVTEDVRAVFLKAALLISEAKGEYVQDSGITGRGEKMQANLTLRVAAERLPEVLNELRQLGDVRSEKTTGEDVTTQVVDLEARLRNEQRVETELLQLLEKREDSPLKEILELRRTIGDVRQSIERLTAQRERLSRLVSLATVLVIIRPADAPPPAEPEEPGLGAYFIDALGGAWHKGTTFLVNTFAGFVSVIIGGLIWWILLIVVIFLVRNHLRRRTAAAA